MDMSAIFLYVVVLCCVLDCSAGFENPTITLNNGVRMPVVALGTGGYDNATAEDAIAKAFSLNLTHVHSAFDYFNLPGVAKGLAGRPRHEVFVTGMTAPCIHPAAPPKRNVSDPTECYHLTRAELNQTLALLDVEYIDLMLLHGPSEPFGYTGGCDEAVCKVNQAQWMAYQDFFNQGHAKAIGVSNYCQSCLGCLLQHPSTSIEPAVNQIQYHVGMGADPENLPNYCEGKKITVQAYSPLAAGALVDDVDCASVGVAHNKSAAQVALRWVLQQPQLPGLVVKADNVEYLEEDLNVFDFELTAAEIERLNAKTSPSGQQDGRPSWGCAM